jgi:hypothetical protein
MSLASMQPRKEFLGKRVLFHATNRNAGQAILQSGQMRPGSGGLFGARIYLAETPNIAQHKARFDGAADPSNMALAVEVERGVGLSWNTAIRP